MKNTILYILTLGCVMSWTSADAATFRAELHSRGYVLYSTFEKPEICEVNVYFTFMHEGKREKGESLCTLKRVPEGKDVQFCSFSHERMVDPILIAPLKVTCQPPEQ